MKIAIPFSTSKIGGTATFAAQFAALAKKNGQTILANFSAEADGLLVITDCSLWQALRAKLRGQKIVQRLDGVYHPATPYGRWYWLYNLKMQIIHNFLADFVIYQSQFSRLSCTQFLGARPANWTVIYNGVDLKAITPRKNYLTSSSPLRLLTFAAFRRRDQIEPILAAVKQLDPEKFKLDIYGSYTDNLTTQFTDLPSHICFKGPKSHQQLLSLINQYDVFLFSDQSACPNSVLEAMAAGLVVIAFDRGSIKELVISGETGKVVELKPHDPFQEPYPFSADDIKQLAKTIREMTVEDLKLKHQARSRAEQTFSLEKMMAEYLKVLNR